MVQKKEDITRKLWCEPGKLPSWVNACVRIVWYAYMGGQAAVAHLRCIFNFGPLFRQAVKRRTETTATTRQKGQDFSTHVA